MIIGVGDGDALAVGVTATGDIAVGLADGVFLCGSPAVFARLASLTLAADGPARALGRAVAGLGDLPLFCPVDLS